MKMDKSLAYLLGLILGRGHINYDQQRIIVEFAHKNKVLEGIAHCHICGALATERKENNPDKKLFCKACSAEVDPSLKLSYDQQSETINSLNSAIIPYLAQITGLTFLIRGNEHMTFLIIDCDDREFMSTFHKYFDNDTSYDAFHIPECMHDAKHDIKVEFMNGVMDTASFPAAGGWLNRDGKHGTGRMRSYFQIVRNWHLPVELCNFLKDMNLPIHTIDWGHPNIRDSSMEDYYNSNPTSWSREHQLKFFPEYYKEFGMRLNHKNLIVRELADHNDNVEFDESDDCSAPTSIGLGKIKPLHFGEADSRIPTFVRCHIDAFWQVCHNIGCKYTHSKIDNSEHKEAYYLTGNDKKVDLSKESNKRADLSIKKKNAIVSKYESTSPKIVSKAKKKKKSTPEEQFYAPISQWLKLYLENMGITAEVYDTSSSYLVNFIFQNDLFDVFESCNNYKIKPDLVGFDIPNRKLHFVEVKVAGLSIKDIGQLLGYCLVAQPETAILVSPKPPSPALVKILASNKGILEYAKNKGIQLGIWTGTKVDIAKL